MTDINCKGKLFFIFSPVIRSKLYAEGIFINKDQPKRNTSECF